MHADPPPPAPASGLVRVGRVAEFRKGRGRVVDFEQGKAAVFRTPAGWLAFSDACPHMGASLAEGRIVGDTVECSWHGWAFDVRTGRNARKEWACIAVYRVHIRGDEVFLERGGGAA